MAVSSEYVAYIQDLLCELVELTTKPFSAECWKGSKRR